MVDRRVLLLALVLAIGHACGTWEYRGYTWRATQGPHETGVVINILGAEDHESTGLCSGYQHRGPPYQLRILRHPDKETGQPAAPFMVRSVHLTLAKTTTDALADGDPPIASEAHRSKDGRKTWQEVAIALPHLEFVADAELTATAEVDLDNDGTWLTIEREFEGHAEEVELNGCEQIAMY